MKFQLHQRRRASRPSSQRGAVAIIVGLSIAVMLGFVGLALDGGHLYLTKTELQNGADACALAASYELTGTPAIPAEAFPRAEAAGITVAQRNRVGFQGTDIASADVTVEFSTALSGAAWVDATSTPPADARYVRCTIERTGISPWFMQVLGIGDQRVDALATATLAPAQTNCAVPMALCVLPGSSAPNYGYVAGNWYGMNFEDTGGAANYTGNFRWIDYNPSAGTPGCSGGGAQELACLLGGAGQCSLPQPITGSCPTGGSAQPTPGCVGQNGAINSLERAYNSRFGIYRNGGQYSLATAPPDFTGVAYSNENWPAARNAYSGPAVPFVTPPNFQSARASHLPTSNPVFPPVSPPFYSNPDQPSTVQQHTASGADRRIVVVPIVDCTGFVSGQHAPIRAYACVLLLDPYRKDAGNQVRTRMEYLGLANDPNSPCVTSGVPGSSTSIGPQVPALVQ